MKLSHFAAFAPVCPVCARAGRGAAPLVIGAVAARTDTDIEAGTLHCGACQHEYPVLSGIPLIVPDLRRLLSERGIELLVRGDLDEASESLLGDAIGPDSWFDAMRQVQSSYGWDGYADLDPGEPAPDPDFPGPEPGAARRCLARLLELAGSEPTALGGLGAPPRILDLGCAVGRTTLDLAAAHPDALVLGLDIHLGLLRIARDAAAGAVSYPRRRIGLVYDRRRFAVDFPQAARVDFWAADALALPFAPGVAGLCVGLNLLDCVPDPRLLLESLATATAPGGRILLATPYDWATRATPVEAWLGGHSQRAPHGGAAEAFLRALVPRAATDPDKGAPEDSHGVGGLVRLAEQAEFPWHTRLHARASVAYRTHLVALRRDGPIPS